MKTAAGRMKIWGSGMDWVYLAQDTVPTPAQVDTVVANYKSRNVDTVLMS